MKNIKIIAVITILAIGVALFIFLNKEDHKEDLSMKTYTGEMEPRNWICGTASF